MLKPTRAIAPTGLPVELDDLKAWIGVDYNDHDAMLTSMLQAATDYFDGYSGILGRAIMPQTWSQKLPGFQTRMRLPLASFQSVTSVQYYDDDNALQTASSDLYGGFEDHLGAYVELLSGQSWPSAYDRADAVEIKYIVGYADADGVPDPIKSVIKMHAATAYEFRESEQFAQAQPTEIYERLIAPYRRVFV